jgi:hypothetical protein
MTQTINEQVNVQAYYFSGREMKTFPRAIEYQGQAVTFADGLRMLVRHGQSLIKIFDMSGADGHTYRLRQDGSQWTLIGTRMGA